MKYIINQNFDIIDDKNKIILFTGTVENVYILNEIETQIWKLFICPCSTNEAYKKFDTVNSQVKVKKEDFCNFLEQLIVRRILILSDD